MRDLSIRGSGDILGGKQAGFIDDIGFEMYMKILQDAINVRMHKDEKPEEEVKNLNVSVDGYIPDDYVESDYEKLDISTHIIGDCKKANVALMRLEMHVMQY